MSLPSSLAHTEFTGLTSVIPSHLETFLCGNVIRLPAYYIPSVTQGVSRSNHKINTCGRLSLLSAFFFSQEQYQVSNSLPGKLYAMVQQLQINWDISQGVLAPLEVNMYTIEGLSAEKSIFYLKIDQVAARFGLKSSIERKTFTRAPIEQRASYVLQQVLQRNEIRFLMFWDLHTQHSQLSSSNLSRYSEDCNKENTESSLFTDALQRYYEQLDFKRLNNYLTTAHEAVPRISGMFSKESPQYQDAVTQHANEILEIANALEEGKSALQANCIAFALMWQYSQGEYFPLQELIIRAKHSTASVEYRVLSCIAPFLKHYAPVFGFDLLTTELWVMEGNQEERRKEALIRVIHFLEGTTKKLDLSYLYLQNLPPIFFQDGYFKALEQLDITGNAFSEVPDAVRLACPHLKSIQA